MTQDADPSQSERQHRQADEQAQQHPEGNVLQSTDMPKQGVVVDDGEPSTQPPQTEQQ